MDCYSSGDDVYESYKDLIAAFYRKYNKEIDSTEKTKNAFAEVKKLYWERNYSVNLLEAKKIYESIYSLRELIFPNLYEKIFISHREKDKDQVGALIELLYAIGIPRPLENEEKMIFCSSHPEAYIENGCMIDEEIKKQFHNRKKVFFIMWYSDNYFESQPCLNEMGAIWVMDKEYQEILAPGFNRKKIGGLLSNTKLSFHADDKYRLNTFKQQLEKKFYLNPVEQNSWDLAKDKFIKAIIDELTE